MQDSHETAVDEALAEFVALQLEGRAPGLEEFLANHPGLADELRSRLSDIQKLSHLWREALHGGPCDDLAEGTRIKDFAVCRQIGRGGMGTVYLAEQVTLGRQVALKVIQCQGLSSLTRQRFLRESHTLARLSHPNLVTIHDAGDENGCLFIAMEYVQGCTLAHALDAIRRSPSSASASNLLQGAHAGAAPVAEASGDTRAAASLDAEYIRTICRILIQVARALQHAHDRGVIHRDIKPSNILLTQDGQPRLADFGLATVNAEPHITLTGEFFGTPHYVSPEQARGQADQIDTRSDVYSLGTTLYECLTLEPPFDGESASDVVAKVLTEEPVPARRRNPHLPVDLDTIVAKAMHRQPGSRYPSAQAFADDLERFLSYRPILARRPGAAARLHKAIRRRPLRAVAVCLAVLAAVSTTVAGLHWHAVRMAARAAHLRQLVDSADVLLYSAAAGPRPMWLPNELRRRKGAALDAYGEAIGLDPSNPWSYMQRARLLLLTKGDLRAASADAQKAQQLRPTWRSPALFLSIAAELASASQPAKVKPAVASRPADAEERPSDPDDHYFLGIGWLMREDREEVSRQLSRCIALEPRHYWAYLDRALWGSTSSDSQLQQPLRDLHAAQSLRPDLPLTWYLQAMYYRNDKSRLDAAIAAMQRALQLAPDDILLLLGMAEICHEAGQNENAVDWIKKALARDPTGRCYRNLGDLYTNMGDSAAALEAYDRCIAANPDYSYIYVAKALLLEDLKRYEEALECCQKALQAHIEEYDTEGHAPAIETMARILTRLGRKQEALQTYGQALELRRYASNGPYTSMAELYEQLKRPQEAQSLLRKGIQACEEADDPNERSRSAEIRCRLAESLWSGGRKEEAIGVFQPVPSDLSVRAAHHYHFGVFLSDRQLLDAAEREWRKCIGLPSVYDNLARGRLGSLYRLTGRYDEAIEECEVLLAKEPEDFHHVVDLASCYEMKKDLSRAAQICRDGIAKYGPHWQFDQVLGRVLNQLGEYEQSDRHFRQALAATSRPAEFQGIGREVIIKEYGQILTGHTQRPADLKQGVEFCRSMLDQEELSNWLRYELSCMVAGASIKLGQPKDAEQAARAAVRVSGGTPLCWTLLALALQQQKRLPEAVDALIEAGDLDPQLSQTHDLAMKELDDSRQYGRAVSVIDRWLSSKQGQVGGAAGERRRVGLLLYKAGMLARVDRLPEASKTIDSIADAAGKLADSPDGARALSWLRSVLTQSGRDDLWHRLGGDSALLRTPSPGPKLPPP